MAGIAIALGIVINRRRGRNIIRKGCISEKDSFRALRLNRHEVHELALEYVRWRLHAQGIKMAYHTSFKRVEVFMHYLARGGYYHQLGRAEGVAMSTAMAYLHDVASFMQQTSAKYVYNVSLLHTSLISNILL